MSNPIDTTSAHPHTDRNLVTRSARGTVNASPDSVWQILSVDFLEISKWAGGVISSTANPATPNGLDGSPYGGRICDIEGMGLTDERIVAYDASRRTLAYSIAAKKIPFFVESMTSTWSVQPEADISSARVTLTVQARTKGIFGRIGQVPLRKMLSGAAPGLLGDLTTWAESSPGRDT